MRFSRHAAIAATTALLGGCGITTGPLANIDPGGRDRERVDADKVACWQAAEATHGSHSRTRAMFMGVPMAIYEATNKEELATRDAKIEQHASACMQARGYKVKQ